MYDCRLVEDVVVANIGFPPSSDDALWKDYHVSFEFHSLPKLFAQCPAIRVIVSHKSHLGGGLVGIYARQCAGQLTKSRNGYISQIASLSRKFQRAPRIIIIMVHLFFHGLKRR